MGPVNWIAVSLAAGLAVAIGLVWNGPLFRTGRPLLPGGSGARSGMGVAMAVMLAAAVMLGHNFARIGAATLAAKPWLYFMMTGGMAAFLVAPAVWLTHLRNGSEPLRRWTDCLYWVVAYLAMGFVFWALG